LAKAHIDIKAAKMAIYGLLVSAPLSHVLVQYLQKAFAGKTSPGARIAQIVASNLLVSPIQTAGQLLVSPSYTGVLHVLVSAYLASMAIINGATTLDEVIKTVKAGFFSVIRVCTFFYIFPACSPIQLE
jgi:peroxisomal membrane protein 2